MARGWRLAVTGLGINDLGIASLGALALSSGGGSPNLYINTSGNSASVPPLPIRLEVFGPDTASTSVFASSTAPPPPNSASSTTAMRHSRKSHPEFRSTAQDRYPRPRRLKLAAGSMLSIRHFNWIDPQKSSVPQFGFIAQQVQQVFPNLISTTLRPR